MRNSIRSLFVLLTLFSASSSFGQQRSPYRTDVGIDAPITGALLLGTAIGLNGMQKKDGLTEGEAYALRQENVNRFDRFSAGYYSESAKRVSDYPFYGSLAAPVALLLLDRDMNKKFGQIGALYIQTLAVTGTLFTSTVALVERSRPLAYNTALDLNQRSNRNSTNSFFAGHTAATATATFFAAKVFNDFHPNSAARPYVWAAAAAVPATVGYLRLRAGKHFLSDNLLGYAVGAGAGILVPHLHKVKRNGKGFSLVPLQGFTPNGYSYSGFSLTRQL
ncbi:phosphatase PAP2 family protein [Hymenobacter sp. HDW8]|nr:phosphatase PAP2 family protein [Hymenobacter sp. HDW8]